MPQKLTCYHVAFTNGQRVHRWRHVPKDEAENGFEAIRACLLKVKVNTLKRLERRKTVLKAHVAKPGTVCHENGMPMITQGYEMTFGS